ncbi:hypothetical protein HHI36_009408, partial [Cryptolaemus montrouzieri]
MYEMSSATYEVQQEIAARLEADQKMRKSQMFSVRGNRSCSEQGPHPGYHLWSAKKTRKRTSAPQMGNQHNRTSLILRSRRSWPVAPAPLQ